MQTALVEKILGDVASHASSTREKIDPFSFHGIYGLLHLDADLLGQEIERLARIVDRRPDEEQEAIYEAVARIIQCVHQVGEIGSESDAQKAVAGLVEAERARKAKKFEDDFRVKKRRALVKRAIDCLGRPLRRGDFREIYQAFIKEWPKPTKKQKTPSERTIRKDIEHLKMTL
jgi:hypothetical protein